MTLNILEDAVTQATRLLDVARLEREAQAFSRGIGFVNRYMAPPHPTVVPEVVVEVVVIDTKRDFGLLRCHFCYVNAWESEQDQHPAGASAFAMNPLAAHTRPVAFIDRGCSPTVQKKGNQPRMPAFLSVL